MSASQDVANTLLEIPEDRFFAAGEFTGIEYALAETDFLGVAIASPPTIQLDERHELPVLLATQQTGLRAWDVSREESSVLVAINLTSGELYFGDPFFDPKAEEPPEDMVLPQPPKPEGANAVALSTGVKRIDARQILDIPWQNGHYRLAAIIFDWLSNSVDVSLLGNGPEAAKRDLNAASADIRIEADPDANSQLLVSGTFSTIADASHIPGSLATDAGGETIGALVSVTLAIFAKNSTAPIRIDHVLPVYADSLLGPGSRIESRFAFDPLAASEFRLFASDYVAYFILDGQIFGPTTFTISDAQ